MSLPNFMRYRRRLPAAATLVLALASGCSNLLPHGAPPPLVYGLDNVRTSTGSTGRPAAGTGAPTLVVTETRAAPGFDSRHIVYVRLAHQLEYFARSEWIDTPARMVEPLIVSALQSSGSFRAAGPAASGITADLRLDTEVLRLQQTFGGGGPSRVRFSLRAMLSDGATRKVVSWREFDETVVCESDDPYGGVVAANRAVGLVMDALVAYGAQAALRFSATNAFAGAQTPAPIRPTLDASPTP